MSVLDLIRSAPQEKVDDLLLEVGEKNYVRVTKHAAVRGPAGLRHRKVMDEIFGQGRMFPYSLLRLDELRILAGLKPRYLEAFFARFGGELVSVTPNLRTTAGITYVCDSLGKTSSRPAVADYLALTEDATAPAAGDTTLTSEITTNGLSRAQSTYGHTGSNAYYTLSYMWTAGGAFSAVQKAGAFNAAGPPPAGTMFVENTFTSTALQTNDQLTVTWTINV